MNALNRQVKSFAATPGANETTALVNSTYQRLGCVIPQDIQNELASPMPNETFLRSLLFETIEQLPEVERDRLLYTRHSDAARLCEWWLANKQRRRQTETAHTGFELLYSILEREFAKSGFGMTPIYHRVLQATAALLMDAERRVLPRNVLEDYVAELAKVDTLFAIMVLDSALPKALSAWSLSLRQAVGGFEFALHSSWTWLRKHAQFLDSQAPESPNAVILVLDQLASEDLPMALRPVFFVAVQSEVRLVIIRKKD